MSAKPLFRIFSEDAGNFLRESKSKQSKTKNQKMEEPNVVQIGKIQFEEFLTSRDINKMKKDEIVAKLAALRLNAK